MRRCYIVYGVELGLDAIATWYAVCHSMERAEELRIEAQEADPNHVYLWAEVIEEGDE